MVPKTRLLVKEFTDETWNTRFLGDLYQDLSEDARKRYALLQTPEFVEEFILDLTLEPAIEEFGLRGVRRSTQLAARAISSWGFRRFLEKWLRTEPERTNGSWFGGPWIPSMAGPKPIAVAIARFRLLVAALRASGSGS